MTKIEKIKANLGGKLKTLRAEQKQSLQKVADAVGASKAHIWELESSKSTNPSLDLLLRMADYFGLTLSQLVEDTLVLLDRDSRAVRIVEQIRGLVCDKDERIK